MDINLIFYCKFCEHKARSVTSHLHHIRCHRNLSKFIYCGLGHCLRSFRTESCFRSHVIRNHKVYCSNRRTPNAPIPSDQHGKFVCGVQHCRTEFFDHRKLMSHLRTDHLDSDLQIPCPFKNCGKTFTSSHSLSGHISKKHKKACQEQGTGQSVRTEPVELYNFVQELPIDVEENFNDIDVARPSSKEETLIGLAQFYQKLEYKHMVPASVTQYISSELRYLLNDVNRTFLNNVTAVLESEKLPPGQISDILSSVVEKDDLAGTCNALRSSYLRKKFYKDRFHFVLPEQVPQENGSFFYYVPIEQTLQAAFKNKNWDFASYKCPKPNENGLLKDFTDGEAFKQNTFFQENPDAIPLIIYQDGFELSNPIGPAKHLEHQLEGIYMAFGNLPSKIRFEKDSIQLIALCKKNEFSRKEVYAQITEDIIKLQESGTDIPNVGNVKAGLAFVAGDNLGSHGLAGLVENFSRSTYFCRYCLVQRKLYYRRGGETRVFATRTVEQYNNAARKAKVDPSGKIKSFEGVKFDSPFNAIPGFHVCTGLPPCLGHDLMEGVIAHDLKLFIQYFVRKGWFKIEELNDMIKKFPYGLEDRKDRPPIIKKLEKSKLAGSAWQIYILLRLFPLIIYGHVKDAKDPVWKLLLQLQEITEITVSPEIHVSHLASFQCLIDEYLVSRRELFPSVPLRPKHHYMGHYSTLKYLYGPLIKVWTLRFESKHTFFKRSWKSSNNSINILQTLAFKHEYFQSWIRSGGGYRSEVEVGECTHFNKSLYSDAIQKAVSQLSQPVSLDECASVTVKGTLYKKGNVLILRQLSNFGDLFHVGIIHLIFVDSHGNVLFLVQQAEAALVYKYGAFKIKKLTDFECVKQNDLMLSYYPHCTYIRDTETYVCLRHAVVSQILDF
ncbi:uncharacterized protein LOC117644297 [Thrips palmi]|uniref:Uncharacterized protein LOC117644297 n=1 Tax=Thrips palmi TaxID=161013 RepID=A0A6P8YRA7_THRPL|nr:uncharacterized protein LOC117644297 [Thrips palmi]